MRNSYTSFSHALFRTALVATIMVTLSAISQAQVSRYTLGVNANSGILATDPGSPEMGAALMAADWNLPSTLLMDFNSAAIKITNDPTSTGNITQIIMTIGDDRFNFADFMQTNSLLLPAENNHYAAKVIADDPTYFAYADMSASVTALDSTPTTSGADDADRIVINFGNGGISPGYSALFEVRFDYDDVIDVDDRPRNEPLLGISNSMFPQYYASYQRILYDTNAPNPPFFDDPIDFVDLSDNAQISIIFDNDAQPEPFYLSDRDDLRTTIANFDHPQPEFQTSTFTGGVPEPTSLALLACGIAGIAAGRRRRS